MIHDDFRGFKLKQKQRWNLEILFFCWKKWFFHRDFQFMDCTYYMFCNKKNIYIILVGHGVPMSKKQHFIWSYPPPAATQWRLENDRAITCPPPLCEGMSSQKKALDLYSSIQTVSPFSAPKTKTKSTFTTPTWSGSFFSMQLPVCRIRSITNYTDVPDHGFLEVHFACLLACLAHYWAMVTVIIDVRDTAKNCDLCRAPFWMMIIIIVNMTTHQHKTPLNCR